MDSIFSFAVDGNWTEWSNWAPCSESCGEATRTRKRYCTNAPPFHGENCTGLWEDVENCVLNKCSG